jgi:hypothetical protein
MAKFVCSFLLSLIEASRSAWCGAPLEMTEGTILIWGTEGLSIRPRCSNPNDDFNFNFNLGLRGKRKCRNENSVYTIMRIM